MESDPETILKYLAATDTATTGLGYAKDVKCPICGTVNRSLDLDETDGWMECESCHNAIQILEYAKSKRVPVYQMADCNLLVPLSKKR